MSEPVDSTHPAGREEGVPSLPLRKAGLFCRLCGSERLRRSRLRREDGTFMLTLQWPVRCLQCNRRQYVSWLEALRAASARSPHFAVSPTESWESYTSDRSPGLRDGGGKRDA